MQDTIKDNGIERMGVEPAMVNSSSILAGADEMNNALCSKDELLIRLARPAAMGEMLNSIAHQWRQPLNNIGLIVQSLQLAYKNGTLTADTMHTGISNTMKLLHQISATIDDFNNFISQKKTLQQFSINDAVRRAVNFMLPALRKKGIAVQWEETEEVRAEGFPAEYTQAFLNLLGSARYLITERSIAEPVVIIRIFYNEDLSVVSVTDNAGKIPDETLEMIFDPGFNYRPEESGAGTGLFISRMIIEKMMHGSLTVCNLDQGAEFRIVL